MAKISRKLRGEEFGYRDIIIPPIEASTVSPSEVELSTNLSRHIKLKIPFVGSPMDTVTEADMAIKLALLGGIGVLHFNYGAPEDSIEKRIEAQVRDLEKVKMFENGFIRNPKTLKPSDQISKLIELERLYGISRVPITLDGTLQSNLVGVVSQSDIRLVKREPNTLIERVMTPLEKLITAPASETLHHPDPEIGLSKANDYLERTEVPILMIVNDGKLEAIVTASDLVKNIEYPLATKDSSKRLKVLAAVETREERAFPRMEALAAAGVDGFVLDTAVFNVWGERIVRQMKEKYEGQDFIVGNFATGKALYNVLDNEGFGKLIDGVKIGVGPGGGCSTHDTTGVGRAQGSAVYDCAQALNVLRRKYGDIGLIADGGFGESGHFVLAASLGADSGMFGKMLAGYEESPARLDMKTGQKRYMGMASPEAMKRGGAARYSLDPREVKAPEGFEVMVDYLGPIEGKERGLPVILAALRQGLSKLNCRTISDLHGNDAIEIVYLPSRK